MRTAVLVAVAGLFVSACDAAIQSQIGEPIEMGPYTFSIVSATQGQQWESVEGTYREVIVRVHVLRDDTPPYTESFSSSFIDSMRIIDAAGNSIGATPMPMSPNYRGGRYRSEYYMCRFRFSRSSEGVRDFERIGTRPHDFRLMITNPVREGSQPRKVAIKLG
jgi:hypothetical protein